MATWTQVVIPRMAPGFPGICPGCLKPQLETQVRVRSEKARLRDFYLAVTKWEHLWVTIPFCVECARLRARWENRDLLLLLLTSIGAFAVAGVLTAWLNVGVWFFWPAFLSAAVILTFLCNAMMDDKRAVRIRSFNDQTITFSFRYSEYGSHFARLNGSAVGSTPPAKGGRLSPTV